MKFTYLLLTFCCFILIFQTASAQKGIIEITGEILDAETQEPVPYVHIVNKSDSVGTVSNTQGRFWISMHQQDTLLFSAIGFETLAFSLKDDVQSDKLMVSIELNTSTLELQPVKVFAFRDEAAIKRALIDTKVPLETQQKGIQLPGFYYGPRKEVKVGLGSPISFIASKFSKAEKEKKKLKSYKAQENYYKVIKSKYNPYVIAEITSLPEKKVEKFMEFCQLPDSFIHRATEYELVIAVNKCLVDFKELEED